MNVNFAPEINERQVVNVPFLQFGLTEGIERDIRAYLYLRNRAKYNGGWVPINKDFYLQGAKDFGVTVRTFRKHLQAVIDLTWVNKVKGKLHVCSLNKLVHQLDIYGAWSVVVRPDDLKGSFTKFQAFLYSCVVKKEISFADHRRKNRTYYSWKDKTRVKRKELTKNIVNDLRLGTRYSGQWSHSLMEKEYGIGLAQASRMQERAVEYGYLARRNLYDPKIDALDLKSREKLHGFLSANEDERYQLWMFRYNFTHNKYRYLDAVLLTTQNLILKKRKRLGKGLKHHEKAFWSDYQPFTENQPENKAFVSPSKRMALG